MLSTKIEITDSVRPALSVLTAAARKRQREGLSVAGRIVRDLWRRKLSGQSTTARSLAVRTGRLRSSIRYRRKGDAVIIGTDVEYAEIHEFGGVTSPHVIRPRRARVLSWVGADGKRRFATKVNHPGSRIPRRPHRAPALRAARRPLKLVMRGKYQAAIKDAKRIGRQHPTKLSYSRALLGREGGQPRVLSTGTPEQVAASGQLAALLGQGG